MRTTIDLPDEQRARLLELAALRREKGYSNIIAEAVARYLAEHDSGEGARERALAVRGALTAEEADEMAAEVQALREAWR